MARFSQVSATPTETDQVLDGPTGGSGFEFWKPIRSACQADRKKLVSEVAGKSEAVQAATQRAKELTEPWESSKMVCCRHVAI